MAIIIIKSHGQSEGIEIALAFGHAQLGVLRAEGVAIAFKIALAFGRAQRGDLKRRGEGHYALNFTSRYVLTLDFIQGDL